MKIKREFVLREIAGDILLVPAAPSRAVAAFVELMHGADFRRYLEESGRLSLLP